MNCTVVRFSTVPFCSDSGDLCEADDGKLATAQSRMPQLPSRFNEASHTAKTIFFLPASLLKMKKLQPSPVNLLERPEDNNDFCKVDGKLVGHSPFPKPHSPFSEHHCFHPASEKLPTQQRRTATQLKAKSSTFFMKTVKFLSIAPL